MSDNRRLLNATAVMASGTAVSRVLGLVRNAMIAIVLGNATQPVEVFSFALTVPNALYFFLAGGTLNSVLVPQIVRAIQHDPDGGQAFVDRIMTGFLVALGALTVLFTLGVPLVMRLYVDARWLEPAMAPQWESLVLMSYITMPQIFFYGMFFLVGQVLNARDRFGPMMWAPIANNVVAIASLGGYLGVWGANAASQTAFNTGQVWWLGLGTTFGILLQTVVLVPYLRKAGFSFHPRFDLKGTGLGRTFSVAKWMVGVVTLIQLTTLVITRLASTAAARASGDTAAAGGINAYLQAQLIWILPHSLLTVSLATAMLPAASRSAANGDLDGVAAETTRTIRLATTLIVPAALAYAALADPFARLIYGHGTGSGDYHVIAWALTAFAAGLIPYTIQYLFLRAFYALSDTRSTFFLQIVISVANGGLAALGVLVWSDASTVAMWLAAAYSTAYLIGVFVTFTALRRRLPALSGRTIVGHLARVVLAAVPAVGVALAIVWFGGGLGGLLWLVASVIVGAVAGVVVYFFVAKRLRVPEATELVGVLRRRTKPATEDTGVIASVGPEAGSIPSDVAEAGFAETGLVAVDDARAREDGVGSSGETPPVAGAQERSPISGTGTQANATPASDSPRADDVSPGAATSPLESPVPVLPGAAALPGANLAVGATMPRATDEPTDEDNLDPDGRGVFIAVPQPVEPLTYPEPTAPIARLSGAPSGGEVLGDRYRLDEQLAQRGTTQTWRAFDEVLDRPVLVHLLAADDPSAPEVVGLARRAAAATDARVLRVLDVVPAEPGVRGAYLIYEYAAGQTLARILSSGPLTGAEAAWVVREIADTLVGLHAQGLYHGHLNPATVLITSTGNVKITGLLVNVAFDGLTVSDDDEAADVRALGDLLYAALTGCWPGAGETFGLPAAPTRGGVPRTPAHTRPGTPTPGAPAHTGLPDVPTPGDPPAAPVRSGVPVPPREVLPSVAPAVAAVVDRICSAVPEQNATRLVSAQDVTTALAQVLGPASAAQDLRVRLRVPVAGGPAPLVAPPAPALPPTVFSGSADDQRLPGTQPLRHGSNALSVSAPIPAAAGREHADEAPPTFVADAFDHADVFTPVPPPARPAPESAPREETRPRWMAPVVLIVGAVLVFGAVVAGTFVAPKPAAQPSATPSPAPSAPASTVRPIVKVDDFDPKADGGDGAESAKDAPLAIDGNPATAWHTERYRSKPTYGGLKPGTGLILDLGAPVDVTSVDLKLVGKPTTVELRVPKGATASTNTANDWTVVASKPDADESTTLTLPSPVSTRYVLVYLTSLPKTGTYYQGGIAEVTVRG